MSNNETYELITLTDTQFNEHLIEMSSSTIIGEEKLSTSEKMFKLKNKNGDEHIAYISKFKRGDYAGPKYTQYKDTILLAIVVDNKVYIYTVLNTKQITDILNCNNIDCYKGQDVTSFKWRINSTTTNTIGYYHLTPYIDGDGRLRVLPSESIDNYKRNIVRYCLSSINNDGFEKVIVSNTSVIKPKNFSSECKVTFKHSRITEDLVLSNIVENIHFHHGIINELYIVNDEIHGWMLIFEYDFQIYLVDINQYSSIKVDDDINSLVDDFMVRLDTIEMAR